MDTQHPDRQAEEWAKTIRSMIVHESEVTNHRITWLVTVQGLLLAGLGFAWDKGDAKNLINVFSILGVLVAISAYTVLWISSEASRDLIKWWDEHKPSSYIGPDVLGARTTPTIRKGILWYLRPWRALPWIFAFGWLLILIINFSRV